jgi:hypothetical protein
MDRGTSAQARGDDLAEASGEPAGVRMSIDELIEHVRATADTQESSLSTGRGGERFASHRPLVPESIDPRVRAASSGVSARPRCASSSSPGAFRTRGSGASSFIKARVLRTAYSIAFTSENGTLGIPGRRSRQPIACVLAKSHAPASVNAPSIAPRRTWSPVGASGATDWESICNPNLREQGADLLVRAAKPLRQTERSHPSRAKGR